MKENDTFREFNSEVGMLPLELVLVDIPEPDPGKLDFRKESGDWQITLFRQPGIVTRLIEHLNLKN